MDGAHRPRTTLTHGIQHRQHLLAEYLADDDSVGIHSERSTDQARHADTALPFRICVTRFQRYEIGMTTGHVVKAEFKRLLNGDDTFTGWNLG